MANWIHVEYEAIRAVTEKAVLFIIEGEEVWLPFSQIASADRDDLEAGQESGSVSITEWIASQKGLA